MRLSSLTEHEVVDRVSVHLLLVEAGGEQLDVAPPTVDALLVLHAELDHQGLVFIAEVIKTGRGGVEASVLTRLQTCGENTRVILI